MTAPLRAFRLRGAAAAAALEWLHVHADVQGAIESEDGREVTVWLTAALPPLPAPFAGLEAVELPSEAANATATGREHDAPIRVADDLLVRPPWVAAPPGFAGVELVVPRGAAFGSGEHDSTKAALRCLHAAWDAPASFADVGCGSGILAAYARARGCARIAACDVEAEAVAATRALVPGAEVVLGGPELLAPAAGIAANLTAAELHAALPAILARWTGRGLLVVGGLRADEVGSLARRLPRAPDHVERSGAFTSLALRGASR